MSQAYDNIKVFEGLDGVRATLGMYLGSTSVGEDGSPPNALTQMFQETISNSLDEFVAGFGDIIKVEVGSDGSLSVFDRGRGMPRGDDFVHVVNALTKTHASGKFDGKAYASTGVAGMHGIGLKAVNAGSKRLVLSAITKNHERQDFYDFYRVEFAKGVFVDGELLETARLGEFSHEMLPSWFGVSGVGTGTVITFVPDDGPISDENSKPVLESTVWDLGELRRRIKSSSALSAGIKIEYVIPDGEAEVFFYENGLLDFMCEENNIDASEVVHVKTNVTVDGYDFGVEMALSVGSGNNRFFANGVPNKSGGTHLDGYRSAIGKALSDFGGKKVTAGDAFSNIDVFCHVLVPSTIFESGAGQTKDALATPQAIEAVRNVVYKELLDGIYDKSSVGDNIISSIAELMEERELLKKVKARKSSAGRTNKERALKLSSKLKLASSRKPELKELYITEGDSASNIGRDTKTQAIMPLRGKIVNAYKNKMARVLDNVEVSSIIDAIGAGCLSDFKVGEMDYHKVILATDADSDGMHIQTLLVGLFFRMFPGLIEAGRLYVVRPPLYKAKKYVGGDLDIKMFYSEQEMNARRDEIKGYEIQRYKGLGEMSPSEVRDALTNVETRRLIRVSLDDVSRAKNTLNVLLGKDSDSRKKWVLGLDGFDAEQIIL